VAKHQLIGAQVSYYTGKVRAYLRYKGIPFDEIAATRDIYRDVILPRTGVRFIPILISDDDIAVQDSAEIIRFLEQRYPQAAVYPDTPVQRLVALLFEVYGDEWLVIPAMHYRWSFPENRAFAIQEFGRLSAPDASPEEQQAIGEKLSGPFAGALPALGVSATSAPAVEASYLAFLQEFDAHLNEHPFLLGTRPSIGDFSLFGPLYAHLYRDPLSGRLMKTHAPRVAEWVQRMLEPEPCAGDFLPDDQIPATLVPLLRRMFEEQGPVLVSTIEHVEAWARDDEGPLLPRAIGTHTFRIGPVAEQRGVFPFNLWRWQGAHDQYHRGTPAERSRADELLSLAGDLEMLRKPIRQRIARKENRLHLA
jgi:glutathione S-transferase